MLFNIFITEMCLLSKMLQLYLLSQNINGLIDSDVHNRIFSSRWNGRNVFAMQSNKTFKCGNQINVIALIWYGGHYKVNSIVWYNWLGIFFFIASIQYPPLELTEIKFISFSCHKRNTLWTICAVNINADWQTHFIRNFEWNSQYFQVLSCYFP